MSEPGVRVTTCDTDEALAAASSLLVQYRRHYGQPPDADDRARGWLTDMARSGLLTVFTASAGGSPDAPPVGLATAHTVPATLAMGVSWQLRDLFVLPDARRRGVAVALVEAVRLAAVAAGATRLSLVTEPDNDASLGLYRALGFRPVEGLVSLSLDLGARDAVAGGGRAATGVEPVVPDGRSGRA